MLVTLIGLPGSGKTTVGRQLARRLHVPFVDSDHMIEERLGCTVREYFERAGEDAFRVLEQEVLDELTRAAEPVVLSTGGGAVLRSANRRCLRERSRVVYLRSHPDELFRRLKHDTTRPLLQVADPVAKLRELFAARDPLYRETAHYVMETGRSTLAALVNMIVMQLEMDGASAHKAV